MKKLLLTGIAVLLLATGAAHTETNALGCFARAYDKAHLYEQHAKGAYDEATWARIERDIIAAGREGRVVGESRLRESAQGDKWSFCLTAGKIWPANQERA